jgi:hypothetical protein
METENFVQNLIKLGAVIVGKAKLCAFTSSEKATDQWIDFHAPLNPRADGYQSPERSTVGGAVALAGYHWQATTGLIIQYELIIRASNLQKLRTWIYVSSNRKHSHARGPERAFWHACQH